MTAIVALALLALALADGGYSTGVYAGATVAIWWTVVVLLALGVGGGREIPPVAIVAGAALGGLAVLSALSLAWASDDGRAFAEAVRAAGYAGLFALVLITSRPGDGRGWLTGIAIAFAAVAVLALASRFEPSLPGGDEDITRFFPAPLARLSYPIGYWNGLALCAAIGCVLLGWLGAVAGSRAARSIAVGAIPLCGLVIYLASSRGGALAAALGLATLLVFGRERAKLLSGLVIAGAGTVILVLLARGRGELVDGVAGEVAERQGGEMAVFTLLIVAAVVAVRWALDERIARTAVPSRVTRPALVALAVAAVVGLIAANPPQRLDEFNDPPAEEVNTTDFVATHITSGTGSGRYQYWSTAIDAFQEEPLRGIGAGGYDAYWSEHGSLARPIRDAHSLIFESLGELGLPGAALLLVFFGAAILGAYRRPAGGDALLDSSAALAMLVAGGAVAATDWIWEIPAAFAPVVIAAALLTGPATQPAATSGPRSLYGWGVATLVAGWLAICAAGIVLLTEIKLDDSHDAVREGDLSAGARAAQDAVTLQPWAAEPRLQLALVEERAGDLAAAREDLDEAIERARDDWRLWLVAARIETEADRIEQAEAALDRARELNPRAPFLRRPEPAVPPDSKP